MIKLPLECKFVAGVTSVDQIPKSIYMPEVAFAGRSNVGKSSLINALVGQKKCARVSASPGSTRQINFFLFANKVFLVDLPGYGYASISKSVRKAWDNLLLTYLKERPNLRRVFLLIDSRHGIKKNDEEMMEVLNNTAVVYQIVLTKIDKINNAAIIRSEIEERISNFAAAYPSVLLTSVKKSIGMQELRKNIL
ncbi:MAG: ribosome biogenesis GTP-binding protein YihA/YsxC [Holosporaceae bacterium]|jgi:GTP-binding protein|nr:ribosome biogenesis GTP-binding protein YihA/YsxC [Holosporaceae bacterium]